MMGCVYFIVEPIILDIFPNCGGSLGPQILSTYKGIRDKNLGPQPKKLHYYFLVIFHFLFFNLHLFHGLVSYVLGP